MYFIKQIILLDVFVDQPKTFTLEEFKQQYHVEEKLLHEMLEYNLFEPLRIDEDMLYLDLHAFQRIQSAIRLQRDLEINLQGVGVVLELLEQLREARRELEVLRK